jgi:hypothetical protein
MSIYINNNDHFVLSFVIINSCLFTRYRTIDGVVAAYGKGKLRCFLGHHETIFDIVSCNDSSITFYEGIHTYILFSKLP